MENAPKLRFEGFDGEWESRCFEDVTVIKSASRVHKEEWVDAGVPFFRSSDVMSAINGTNNEKVFISEELYQKLAAISGKLEKGDVLVTGGGSVGNPYIVPDNRPLYTKDADLLWIKRSNSLNPQFVYQYFFSASFRSYMKSISHVGTIAHFTITQLEKTKISLPSLGEQERIGILFQHFDRLITLHQRKYDALLKAKQFYLQNLFPKKGEKKPCLRFVGFSGEWEENRLGELAIFNPKAELPEIFEYVDLESVVGTEIIAHRTENKKTAPSRAQRLAQPGDVFYQTVRPYQKNNYLFEKNNGQYVFSTGYAQMRPHIDGHFLFCLIQNDDFINTVLEKCTGTSYPAISSKDLSEISVSSPSDSNEQQTIGHFFMNLNQLINANRRKLETLKKMKQFMLQNLFV